MRNREKLENNCLYCNKAVKNSSKYCANKCQQNHQTKLLLDSWLSGINIVSKGGCSVPTWMRKFLLEENGYKCSECGWNKINVYTNKIPLDIDHIDGNAYNNLKDNLRAICPNCHSLKETFKNTGSRKSARNYRRSISSVGQNT